MDKSLEKLVEKTRVLRSQLVELITDLNTVALKLCDLREDVHKIELMVRENAPTNDPKEGEQ